MPDVAASNVTYVVLNKEVNDSSNRVVDLTVAFGDGALTYPAGGIPLTASRMGAPNRIISGAITSPASANGYVYKYDQANNKVRIYEGDNNAVADGPLVELTGSAAPAATTLYLSVRGW